MTAYTVEIAAKHEHGADGNVIIARVDVSTGTPRITDITLRGGTGVLPSVDLEALLDAVLPGLVRLEEQVPSRESTNKIDGMRRSRQRSHSLRIRRATTGGRYSTTESYRWSL